MRVRCAFQKIVLASILAARGLGAEPAAGNPPEDQEIREATPGSGFGSGIVGLGDVNGDGLKDFAVRVPNVPVPGGSKGEVRVFLGGRSGVAPEPFQRIRPPGSDQESEFQLSSGDLDRDGRMDLLLGVVVPRANQRFQFCLWIFRGSPRGFLAPESPAFCEPTAGGIGAFAVFGDCNGDGYLDISIGKPWDGDQTGELLVLFGNPELRWTEPSQRIVGSQAGEFLASGYVGRLRADFNRDGYDDLAVGSTHYAAWDQENGRVLLFLGSEIGLRSAPSWTAVYPIQPRKDVDPFGAQYFGNSAIPVGDVNRDGYPDLAISAPFAGQNDRGEGIVFGYYGSPSGLPSRPSWSVQKNRPLSGLGLMVEPAGDVNGDGFPDLLVGAPEYSDVTTREGLIAVFLGAARGFGSEPGFTARGDRSHARLGLYGAGVGDLNADGFDDLVVSLSGEPGSTQLDRRQDAIRIIYGTAQGPRNSTETPFGKPVSLWLVQEWRLLSTRTQWILALAAVGLGGGGVWVGRCLWRRRTIVLVERRERESRARERERLARDLHDGLGCHLSRIHLSAEIVRNDPLNPGLVFRITEEITREAHELRLAMGQLVQALKLGDDSLEGFVVAVSDHAESFFSGTPVSLHQRFPEDLDGFRIAAEVKAELFPAVREALNNVLRHAKATELWIRVVIDTEALQILIEDNGVGFDPARQKGNGLSNFRERMSLIGADVRVVSSPGNGTTVCFRVPRIMLDIPRKPHHVGTTT